MAKGPEPHFRLFSLSVWVPLVQIFSFRSVTIQEFDSDLDSTSSQVISSVWVSRPWYFGVNSDRTWQWGGRRAAVSLGGGGGWSMANLDCYIHLGQSNHSSSPWQKALTISSDTLIYIHVYDIYTDIDIQKYIWNIFIYTYKDICAYTHKYIFSVECGGRKPEEPSVEMDVCRNVEGARECTVDLTGCLDGV